MSPATAGPRPHTPTSVMPLDDVRERRATDGDLPSGGEIGVALDRAQRGRGDRVSCWRRAGERARRPGARLHAAGRRRGCVHRRAGRRGVRSEEHTSELQSLMRISYAVFCLKKKKTVNKHIWHNKSASIEETHTLNTILHM